jgi:GNAT superfamily N-acetyltransferase
VECTFRPLTEERWGDLERLFGARGACAGCWCMYWRLGRAAFEAGKGEPNRRAFRSLVRRGTVPGVLAYEGEKPIGWCAVEPRSAYPALERSRTMRALDDRPVWSVTCFFIARPWRRRGLSVQLLEAAVQHACTSGATLIEGYPSVPRQGRLPDAFAWTGVLRTFERAGFTLAARPSEARRIMRKELTQGPQVPQVPEVP